MIFETPYRAATGYVLAKDAWGQGYATEALERDGRRWPGTRGVRRLYAMCHHAHRASAHVLEKCGFTLEGVLRRYAEFPNLDPVEPHDVPLLRDDFLKISSGTEGKRLHNMAQPSGR